MNACETLELRQATAADAEAIAALERACIEVPWTAAQVRETIAEPHSMLIVLYAGGRLLGYAGQRVVFETAEVYNIAVEEASRRRGYGSKLLHKLLDAADAAGAKQMLLEVNPRNTAAVALYKKNGFEAIATRENYYHGQSATVMKKQW